MLRWVGTTSSSAENLSEVAASRSLNWWHGQADVQSAPSPATGHLVFSDSVKQSCRTGFLGSEVGTIASLQRSALPGSALHASTVTEGTPASVAATASLSFGRLRQASASSATWQPELEPNEMHGEFGRSRGQCMSPPSLRPGHLESRISPLRLDASQDSGFSQQLRLCTPITADHGPEHVDAGALVQCHETDRMQMAKVRGQVEELLGMSRNALQELNMVAVATHAGGSMSSSGTTHGNAGSQELAGLQHSLVSLTESVDKLVTAQGRETQLLEQRLGRLEDEARLQLPVFPAQTSPRRSSSPVRSLSGLPSQLQTSALAPAGAVGTLVDDTQNRVGCIVNAHVTSPEKQDSEAVAAESESVRPSIVVEVLQDQLKKANIELKVMRRECEHVRSEAGMLRLAEEQARMESSQRNEEIDCLQQKHVKKCKELMSLSAEVENAHGESTELGCRVHDLQQELKITRHSLAQAEKAHAESMHDSQCSVDLIQQLKLQLRDAQLALENACCESMQHREETTRLQRQHAAKCNELTSMWSQVEIAHGESEKLGSIVYDLQQQLKSSRTSLVALEKQNADSLVQELRRQLKDAHAALRKATHCPSESHMKAGCLQMEPAFFEAAKPVTAGTASEKLQMSSETQTEILAGNHPLLQELQEQLSESKTTLEIVEQSHQAESKDLSRRLQDSEKSLAGAEERHEAECEGLMWQVKNFEEEFIVAEAFHLAEIEMRQNPKVKVTACEVEDEGPGKDGEGQHALLTALVEESQAESEQLRQTICNLEKQLHSTNCEFECMERLQQEACKAREETLATCEQRVEELLAVEHALELCEQSKRTECQTHTSTLRVSQQKADNASAEAECLASLVEELQQEMQSAERASGAAKVDRSQQTNHREGTQDPDTEAARLRATVQSLQSELAKSEQQITERQPPAVANFQTAALRSSVRNLQSELATTKTSLMDAESQIEEMQIPNTANMIPNTASMAAVQNLQSELATSRAALMEAEKQLQERQPKIKESLHMPSSSARAERNERKEKDGAAQSARAERNERKEKGCAAQSALSSGRRVGPAPGPARRIGVVVRNMQLPEGLFYGDDSDYSEGQAEAGEANVALSWPNSPLSDNDEGPERPAPLNAYGTESALLQTTYQAEANEFHDDRQWLGTPVRESKKEMSAVEVAQRESEQIGVDRTQASEALQNALSEAGKCRSEGDEACSQSAHLRSLLLEEEEQIRKVQHELSNKLTKDESTSSDSHKLLAEVTEWHAEADSAEAACACLTSTLLEEQDELKRTREELEEQKEHASVGEHSTADRQPMLAEVAQFKAEVKEAHAKCVEWNSQMSEELEKRKRSRSELELALTDAARWRSEAEEACSQSAHLRLHSLHEEQQVRNGRREIQDGQHQVAKDLTHTLAEVEKLRADAEAASTMSDSLSLKLSEEQFQLQEARHELAKHATLSSDLHAALAEVSKCRGEADDAKAACARLTDVLLTEQDRLTRTQEELEQQKQRAREGEKSAVSLQQALAEAANFKAEAQEREKHERSRNDLQQELADVAKWRTEAEEAQAKSAQLNSQLIEELEKHEHSRCELQQTLADAAKWRTAAEESRAELQGLHDDVAKWQALAESSQKAGRETQAQIELLKAEAEEASSESKRLSFVVQDLQHQLKISQISLEEANARYHGLYAEFTNVQQQADAARAESDRLGNMVQDQKNQLQKARKAFDEADASYQELHAEFTRARTDAATTSGEIAKLQAEAEDARAESAQLGSQLKDLQQQMRSAQFDRQGAEHFSQEKQVLELEVARVRAEADDALAKLEELKRSVPEEQAQNCEQLEKLRASFKDARADCRRLRRESVQLQESQSASAELEARLEAEVGAARDELRTEAAELRKARASQRMLQSARAVDTPSLGTTDAASSHMTWC